MQAGLKLQQQKNKTSHATGAIRRQVKTVLPLGTSPYRLAKAETNRRVSRTVVREHQWIQRGTQDRRKRQKGSRD